MTPCPHYGMAYFLQTQSLFWLNCSGMKESNHETILVYNQRMPEPGHIEPTQTGAAPADQSLTWDIDIPLLTNPVLVLRFFIVMVISVLLLEALTLLMALLFSDEIILLPLPLMGIALGVITVLFVLVCLLIYRNRFSTRFSLTAKFAAYQSGPREGKITRVVSIFALLTGNLRAIGPALVGESQQADVFEWQDLRRAQANPRLHVVTLYNSWRPVLDLYCPPEMYPAVLQFVEERLAKVHLKRQAHPVKAARRSVGFILLWIILAALATFITPAWSWVDADLFDRYILLTGVVLLLAGLLGGVARWLLGLVGAGLSLYLLVQIILSAMEKVTYLTGMDSFYTYELDTGFLILAVLGAVGFLLMSGYCLLHLRNHKK